MPCGRLSEISAEEDIVDHSSRRGQEHRSAADRQHAAGEFFLHATGQLDGRGDGHLLFLGRSSVIVGQGPCRGENVIEYVREGKKELACGPHMSVHVECPVTLPHRRFIRGFEDLDIK